MADNSELPDNIAACRAMIEQLFDSVQQMSNELKLLKKSVYGSKRERYIPDPNQPTLFPQETDQTATGSEPSTDSEVPEPSQDGNEQGSDQTSVDPQADTESTAEPTKQRRGRQRRIFPDCLPHERVEHRLDEADIPEQLRGRSTFFKLVRSELEYTPAQLIVKEHFQEILAAEEEYGETTIVEAARPPLLVSRCFAGPGLLAYLTVSRFCDHLPYYRLEDIMARCGIRIHRSTQWRWMRQVAIALTPLIELMRQRILSSMVLGIDETPVPILDPLRHGTRKSYLWAVRGDESQPYTSYYFTTTRAHEDPNEFLRGFKGYLLSDAYIVYDQISRLSGEMMLPVSCWVHARRKFMKLHELGENLNTRTALAYFRALYEIEDRARPLSSRDRFELRAMESRPIVDGLYTWLEQLEVDLLPKDSMREAVSYMTNRWVSFERFLENGDIPIDNNMTEAAIKYAVMGKKNWLYFGNKSSGETSAVLYSFIVSCKRHFVDPLAYLTDVYTRLPETDESELEELLPDRWLEKHPQHFVEHRQEESASATMRKQQRRAERNRMKVPMS